MSATTKRKNDSSKIAREYLERGWKPIPIAVGEKGPKSKGWQDLDITTANIGSYFNGKDLNIGVQLGPKSNGLSDVDLDCPEAIRLARVFLPQTGAVFGRASKPASHYLYTVTDPEPRAAIRLSDEAGGCIIEARLGGAGKAAQTVFPGSQHPSGEAVRWDKEGEPAAVPCATLRDAITKIAIGVMLMRKWPSKGRHDAAMRVSGLLARAGWDEDTITHFIEHVARAAEDDEIGDRIRAATDTVASFQRGENVFGLPGVQESFGEDTAKAIAKLLAYREHDHNSLMERMNNTFSVVLFGGKARILKFEDDAEGYRAPTLLAPADFRMFYDSKKVHNVTDGKEKKVGEASWWLNSSDRRQYDGVVFLPGQPKELNGKLNLWEGFGIEPKAGEWPRMERHIHEVLASGNSEHADYIIKWSAWALQNPDKPAEVALTLRGPQGTGKGIHARSIKSIFGPHGRHLPSIDRVTGRFNATLMNCAFIYLDEALWGGDKKAIGPLKMLLTEPTIAIEKKGVDTITVKNHVKAEITTNEEWAVPAGFQERRFAVFDVSTKYMQSEKYFAPLYAEMEGAGLSAMMFDLLNMDLGDWHPRRNIPRTDALLDQQLRSLSPEDQWWFSLVTSGLLPQHGMDSSTIKTNPRRAKSGDLFELARKTVPGLHFASDHRLGIALRKRGCLSVEVQKKSGWEFPPLADARTTLEALFRRKIVWDRAATDWGSDPM
jgi:hypothetical protein